jgi:hypothetical protein
MKIRSARRRSLTSVTWGVPHIGQPGEQPETNQQGGELMESVTLTPGDNQVFLTYRDEPATLGMTGL